MTVPDPELTRSTEIAFLNGQGHELRQAHQRLSRFRMRYKFAIDEVTTKIAILREEFAGVAAVAEKL
jgi:hypothetical protein